MNPQTEQTNTVYNTVSPGFQDQSQYNQKQNTNSPYGQFVNKKRRVWPWILFVLLILVLAASGFAYAYYVTPTKAIPNAFASLVNLEKSHSILNVVLVSEDEQMNGSNLSVVTDSENVSGKYNLSTNTDLSSDDFGAISLGIKYIDDILYAKTEKVPAVFSMFVGPYVNKWFSLNLSSVKKLYEDYSSSSTVSTKISYQGVNVDANKIYSILLEKGIIDNVKFTGVGIDSGSYIRKYSMSINKDNILNSVDENIENLGIEENSPSYVSRAQDQARSSLEDVDFSSISIHVDAISGDFHSISFDVKVPSYANTSEKDTVQVKFINLPKLFGGIEVPEDVTSLDDMLLDVSKNIPTPSF